MMERGRRPLSRCKPHRLPVRGGSSLAIPIDGERRDTSQRSEAVAFLRQARLPLVQPRKPGHEDQDVPADVVGRIEIVLPGDRRVDVGGRVEPKMLADVPAVLTEDAGIVPKRFGKLKTAFAGWLLEEHFDAACCTSKVRWL